MKKEYDSKIVNEISAPLKNRPGHFAIFTNGGDVFQNPSQREELRLIMESVIIIQATHVTSIDQIAYVALCEQFEPVENDGSVIPSYVPMFEIDDNGNRTKVIWEKRINYINNKKVN